MGRFSRIFRKESKSVSLDDLVYFTSGGVTGAQGIPKSYAGVTREGYEINPYVYRCVDLRASAVANVDPIVVGRDGDEIEDPDHPLKRLLTRPNPSQSWYEFIHTVESHKALWGNAFILPIMTVRGPTELWTISPDIVSYMPSNSLFDPVDHWILSGDSMTTLPPNGLIHIHSFRSSDPVLGSSPLMSAGLSVAQQNAAREWNLSMLKNGAKPSLAITMQQVLTKPAFQEFKNSLRSEFTGPKKAGSVMVMDGGKSVVPVGFNPTEMDWTQSMIMSAREIAIALKVPPELVGDSTNKTYSNSQEANKEFATGTIDPECNIIYAELSHSLSGYYKDVLRITYDRMMIPGMRGDQTQLMQAVNMAEFLTINEKRAALGYDEIPNGDRILVGMGKVPYEESLVPLDEIPDPRRDADGDPSA